MEDVSTETTHPISMSVATDTSQERGAGDEAGDQYEPSTYYLHPVVAAQQELHQRQQARRLRHLRNVDRAQAMQQQFQAAGLERRRWLPVCLRRPLRWFYCESGLVESSRGAVVATSLLMATFLLTCYSVRQYCCYFYWT